MKNYVNIVVVSFALVFAGCMLSLGALADMNEFPLIWLGDAIGLSLLLMLPRQLWSAILIGQMIAHITANLIHFPAIPVWQLVVMGLASAIEVFMLAWVLRRYINTKNIFERRNDLLLTWAIAAICAPLLGASIGAIALMGSMGYSSALWLWFRADALGMLVWLPFAFGFGELLQEKSPGRFLAGLGLMSVAIASICFATFTDLIPLPLFAIALLALIATFTFGALGGAMTVAIVAVLASAFLMRSESFALLASWSEQDPALLLQLFVASLAITIVPASGSVSSRRKALEREREARIHATEMAEAKAQFLASMSHELRTPLNAILGFAQLIEIDKSPGHLNDKQRTYVKHIADSGHQLLDLITDLLDLSQMERKEISIKMEAVSVSELVDEFAAVLEPFASAAEVKVTVKPVPASLRIFGDRRRLRQILLNFGTNAIKYNRPGGEVFIEARFDTHKVRLLVEDDGPGIPADRQAEIFEPFNRLGKERGTVEGVGIGLALAHQLAERMNCDIGFTSENGKGTRIWLDCDYCGTMETTETAPPTALQPADQAVQNNAARHIETYPDSGREAAIDSILYIEDNSAAISLMREILARTLPVKLITETSVSLGYETALRERPSLIITDLHLPDGVGTELAYRLAQEPRTASIPIIALTADLEGPSADRAHLFQKTLIKPLNVSHLLEAISASLGKVPDVPPRQAAHGRAS
nr:ATP-binding protein [Pacificimonas pallii]